MRRVFLVHVCTKDKRAFLGFSEEDGANHIDKFYLDGCNHFKKSLEGWKTTHTSRLYES